MRISDYLIRPVCTSTEPSGQYNKQLEAYNLAVNLINRMTHPIPEVCDIDAIRDEIKELSYPYNIDAMRTKSDVLQIIDRHMKGESDAT